MVSHAKLDEPVVLTPDAICSRFPIEDINEGEEPDLSEYIDEAYEQLLCITGSRRRRRFLP
jgi:hypothetical protein